VLTHAVLGAASVLHGPGTKASIGIPLLFGIQRAALCPSHVVFPQAASEVDVLLTLLEPPLHNVSCPHGWCAATVYPSARIQASANSSLTLCYLLIGSSAQK
jgi:hypothetical protein